MATARATSSGPFMARLRFWRSSGKDGSLLWTFSADLDNSARPRCPLEDSRPGRVMGAPAMADVDGDGTADLIAEFAVFDDPKGLVSQPGTPARRGGEPRILARPSHCRGRVRPVGKGALELRRSTGNPRT